ncbi:trypsin-like serine peptidase [Gymnodinialimonas ulvae]|uniref:trypsin-like serine peptidase n=1 Tax=Gymnodinialimonas ulvae TaxID=3126504 RepID=UPI0030B625D1
MTPLARILLCLALALPAAAPAPTRADVTGAPDLIDTDRAAELTAIARLRRAEATTGGCTAVLVAPSAALTAAHCLARPRDRVLILDPTGPNRMVTAITDSELHPTYDPALQNRVEGYVNDLALLHLATPVPPEVARPMPLAAPAALDETIAHATFGYVNRRAIGLGSTDALRGHTPCPAVSLEEGPIASPCAVAGGQSGGAFVHMTDTGPVLVGLLVSNFGRDGLNSLISPVTPADWPALAEALAE